MKKLTLVLWATICLAGPSFAQSSDATPPASEAAPADQGAGETGGSSGGGKMKEIMQSCRTEAQGQGLKGHELRQAVMDCAVKQKPGMAGRLKCRMAGMDKGLKKDDLKTYVQSCMKGSG